MNQTAQHLASKGRYGDTMLVHMSPQEVRGLQALARKNGTNLTVNPQTGLPEAFNLKRLLPMIAGAGLTAVSGGALSPLTIGLMTGGIGALATGSLKEGLMMGLGAAGGAGLAGSATNLAAPAAGGAANTAPVVTGANAAGSAAGGANATGVASSAYANPVTSLPSTNTLGVTPISSTAPVVPSTAPIESALSSGATNASSFNAANITPSGTEVPLGTTDLALKSNVPSSRFTFGNMSDNLSRTKEGFGKAFESPEAAGEFLGSNKMNLAMSGAPLLIQEPADIPEDESYIRPYTLDIENLSDRPASATGREDERLRYRYTAGTPYRAAQGGIIAFAEGGNTTDGLETGTSPVSPEAARVYQSIANIQGQAGLPQLDLSTMPIAEPSPVARLNAMSSAPAFTPTPAPSSEMIDYRMGMPNAKDSEVYRQLQDRSAFDKIFKGFSKGYAEGGEARSKEVRKKIDRMADPYTFAAYQSGRGLYDAALQNFAGGGLSNVPRFLSGGGDGMSDSIPATINNRQPARLADGEFVIPADVVSHLGNGSSKAGAKQLYAMMDRIRAQRTGRKKQAPAVNPRKSMPA